jgi:phosphocarrier,  HPr family
MVSEELKVINPSGLHLRPAGNLCKEALKYDSKINIIFKDATANAKSVLSVLATCVKCGDVIKITCDGRDENEALEALKSLINSGFGELK